MVASPVRHDANVMIRRLPDWLPRLLAYVERTRELPFQWGANDCTLWAAGALDAMCGTHVAAQFYGCYVEAGGAASVLRAQGWGTLRDPVQKLLGDPMANGLLAARGSVVWMPYGSVPVIHDPCGMGMLGVLVDRVMCPAQVRMVTLPLLPLVKRGALVFAVPGANRCPS